MNKEDKITTDQLFKIIMIDRKRKVKMNIQLRDETGDEIPVRETIEKLTEWVTDKLKSDKNNVCQQQILPLMGQAVCGGMIKLMGPEMASIMLSQETTRFGLTHMMTVGFYLLKWLQKKKIKIHTFEEAISSDDIAMYDRVSQASDLSVQTAVFGGDPKDTIRKLIKSGRLKKSDLEQLGVDANWDESDKKTEAN